MLKELSQEDKKLIDSADKKQLISWHNAGYNGNPAFWFYVHNTLVKKYPSKNPQYFFE